MPEHNNYNRRLSCTWAPQLLLVACCAMLMTGCAIYNVNPLPPVSVRDVIQMSKAGDTDVVIISRIRNSGTVYRMSASQLANLRDEGVSDAVVNYMQQTYLGAVRRNQQLNDEQYMGGFYGGYYGEGYYPFGWGYDFYPDMFYPYGDDDDE